ncbi:Uncharacterised protein [Edwardsiella tarda]|nr:Uncharacterised protein [Edwardsiella tarda]
MKIKHMAFIALVIVCLLFYSQYEPRRFFHTIKKTGNVIEHIDIDIGQMRFNIIHYVTKQDGALLLSEIISGIYIKNVISGAFYLKPLEINMAFSDNKYNPSLSKLGSGSVCIYKEVGNNSVIFWGKDRGMLSIDKEIIHLPSLFLAKEGQKHN